MKSGKRISTKRNAPGNGKTPKGLRGVIFDMDGTLTVPLLDFRRIRAELGLSGPEDLAVQIERMPAERRRKAWEWIERHEAEAAGKARLRPHARELLEEIRRREWRLGLLTRNTRQSVELLCDRFDLCFDRVLTREHPFIKPRPEPVLTMCADWNLSPAEVLVVGDYRHDIECGRRAGAPTCFVRNPGATDFSDMADYAVDSLLELHELLFR